MIRKRYPGRDDGFPLFPGTGPVGPLGKTSRQGLSQYPCSGFLFKMGPQNNLVNPFYVRRVSLVSTFQHTDLEDHGRVSGVSRDGDSSSSQARRLFIFVAL